MDPLIAPEHRDRLARFGFQAALVGEAEASIFPLILAVNGEPKNASYRVALGIAFAKAGRSDLALKELRQALALRPKDIEVWCIVGELSLDLLDYQAAARAFAKCLELDPTGAHPAGLRARALIKKGEKILKQATIGRS